MKEAELVRRLRQRDQEAVKEMISLHGDRLMASAYLLCGSEAEAKDLVQDTFVQAVKVSRSFLGRSSLYTWLHGILYNLHRNSWRKRKRLHYTQNVPERDLAYPPDTVKLDADINAALLADAVEQLSELHRQVVILHYFNGMNVPEIARHCGISVGTAKSRLHYALKQLQGIFGEK